MTTLTTLTPPKPFYPDAKWMPLLGHSNLGLLADKNTVVLHSAEGFSANGIYETFRASVSPRAVSAHFAVDRDPQATVCQFLALSDIAWHASQANVHSIGIEHACLSKQGADSYNNIPKYKQLIAEGKMRPFVYAPATETQYLSSAKLVAWLCKLLGVSCDRNHVRGHNEVSPADHHTLCPEGALSVDRVVDLAKAL